MAVYLVMLFYLLVPLFFTVNVGFVLFCYSHTVKVKVAQLYLTL